MSDPAVRGVFVAAFTFLLLAIVAGPLAGQAGQTGNAGALVETIRFEGVSVVSESELRASIVTQATRCRSVLHYPFCKLIGSGAFVERHHLDERELPRDELRVRLFYWLRGYRSAAVTSAVTRDGDGVAVTFRVDEGEPTQVERLDVRQVTPVLDAEVIEAAGFPAAGDALSTIVMDTARVRLIERLWELGHPDATVVDTAVPVGAQAAAVTVTVDPGPRATISGVDVTGNERVSERTVLRILDLDPGETFRRDELVAGQRRLVQSELFRQSEISFIADADTTRRVLVNVQEAPMRGIELGVGFSTVEFGQGQARFTRYNWFGGARRLDVRGAVGNLFASQLQGRSVFGAAVPRGVGEVEDAFLDPTWQLSADFSQPFLFGSRNSLGVGGFGRRRSVLGIVVDRGYGGNLSLSRRLTEGVLASAIYQFESTRVDAGDVYYCVNFGVCEPATIGELRGWRRLSPISFVATADRMDDPLAPTDGYTVRVEAEHASSLTASDFGHHRVTAEATRYLPAGPGVLAGRARVGWVRSIVQVEAFGAVGAVPLLHPRKRFYAGGARSVRGFGENQLGPLVLTIDPAVAREPVEEGGAGCTDETILSGGCDASVIASSEFVPRPLGGNRLFEANIEYRLPLWGPVGVVGFIDGAILGDSGLNMPSGGRAAITPGFGIRYLSPVGPVRVDLGIRPTLTQGLPIITTVDDEDGRARLVQLDAMKRYDPLEGSGGFFSQILTR